MDLGEIVWVGGDWIHLAVVGSCEDGNKPSVSI